SRRSRPRSRSSLQGRLPTYPMIPHIRSSLSDYQHSDAGGKSVCQKPPEKRYEPGVEPLPASEASAELCSDECGDASTERLGLLRGLGLGEHAYDGLGARRPHEHAPTP